MHQCDQSHQFSHFYQFWSQTFDYATSHFYGHARKDIIMTSHYIIQSKVHCTQIKLSAFGLKAKHCLSMRSYMLQSLWYWPCHNLYDIDHATISIMLTMLQSLLYWPYYNLYDIDHATASVTSVYISFELQFVWFCQI